MERTGVKQENGTTESSLDEGLKSIQLPKPVFLNDLNIDPPDVNRGGGNSVQGVVSLGVSNTNGECSLDKGDVNCKEDESVMEREGKRVNKSGKCRSRSGKMECLPDYGGGDVDGDQVGQCVRESREEKISSLKTGLVHVARKMPKNSHAHYMLGLMYQRLGQYQKAIQAYEKAAEILLSNENEISRPEFLSLVQVHNAQCLLLDSLAETGFDKELEPEELKEIVTKLKESMQLDFRQAAVWNSMGLLLLRTGRLQSAISVLSSLLVVDPTNFDCLGNLGIAYLQSGNLELSEKCFQELILKEQNHPAALVNYAAFLSCKYGSVVAGAGANAGDGASCDQVIAANVAKECLLAALKVDPKSAHMWANLANVYYMAGDHRSSSKCLEKAAKVDPTCMSTRYAVAIHRVKDAERSQDPNDQLSLAGNEMASILRDGDSALIEQPIAWAGLAMVHKVRHEIAATFEMDRHGLLEIQERAILSLKQAIAEDPDDAVHWHQLGLHHLCTQQFKASQKYLKAAIARTKECSYAWSNLGISLQLSNEPLGAEEVYKRALAVAVSEEAHATFSNLGNLYRQQKQYERAKAMFAKALQIQPGYAPAYNNLGLVFVAEGRWDEATFCFNKAFEADPWLDAAKSNMIKAQTMSRVCTGLSCMQLD